MKKLSLMVASLFLAGVALAGQGSGAYPDISHQDLVSAIAAKSVVVLDANGSASYKKGHIPGAIDFSANKDNLAEMLPKDKNTLVVAYCANENCPAYARAAKAAAELGYTNVKHYSPGIAGWRKSGAQIETDA